MATVTKGYARGMLAAPQFYALGMLLAQNFMPWECCQHSLGMLEMILRAKQTRPLPGVFPSRFGDRALDYKTIRRGRFSPDNRPGIGESVVASVAFLIVENCKLL